jgi:hypothetical protein
VADKVGAVVLVVVIEAAGTNGADVLALESVEYGDPS